MDTCYGKAQQPVPGKWTQFPAMNGLKKGKPQAVDISGTAGKFLRNPERWTHSFSIGFL
jgi:hypothetical protein